MLVALELPQGQRHPLLQRRQGAAGLGFLVLALDIEHGIPLEADGIPRRFEQVFSGGNIRLAGILHAIGHQAGDEPFPDQLVQPILV